MKSGVTKYTRLWVEISFPDDQVCCQLCPLLETYSRKQCRATGEYLKDAYIDRYVGGNCPLVDPNNYEDDSYITEDNENAEN